MGVDSKRKKYAAELLRPQDRKTKPQIVELEAKVSQTRESEPG